MPAVFPVRIFATIPLTLEIYMAHHDNLKLKRHEVVLAYFGYREIT
jgi:hypothetical protein